jgi:hypothetical protein
VVFGLSSVAYSFPNFIFRLLVLVKLIKDLGKVKPWYSPARAPTLAHKLMSLVRSSEKIKLPVEDVTPKTPMKQAALRSLTVVVPCYMPNEESIIMDTLAYYRKQETEYDGELHILLVWNSPQEHPAIEAEFKALKAVWPVFDFMRVQGSTSKCDNLNAALQVMETEMVLLIDADTEVPANSMNRAAECLFGALVDFVQGRAIYSWRDTTGRLESGCFPLAPAVVIGDTPVQRPPKATKQSEVFTITPCSAVAEAFGVRTL